MTIEYRESQQTVLVVDDDANVVELTRLYLERDGYRVVSASDGALGLALARDEQPSLVVLDVMLPRVNGLDVCRTLRQESGVPIIMLTARVEEDDRLAGLDLGADDYVTKPFSPRELAARVRAVLRRAASDNAGASARDAFLRACRAGPAGQAGNGWRQRIAADANGVPAADPADAPAGPHLHPR